MISMNQNLQALLSQLKENGITLEDLIQQAKQDEVKKIEETPNEELIKMFLEYKLETQSRDELTIEAYQQDLTQFLNWYQTTTNKSLLNITKREAENYIYYLRTKARTQHGKPYSLRSIIRKHATLSSFYEYLDKTLEVLNTNFNGKEERNMFKAIEQISTAHLKNEHDSLTEAEVEELVRTIETETKRRSDYIVARNHLLFRIILSSGLRVSEALKLTLDNLDYRRNIIGVVGKRNKYRETLFVEPIRDEIERYKKIRATVASAEGCEDLLFINENGTAINYRKVNKALQKYLEASNIDLDGRKITTHSLRHTFATLKIQNGDTIERVSDFCGHSDVNFTRKHYVHTTTTVEDEAISRRMGIK